LAFIPIYDGNPYNYIRRPWVSWSLILVNVVIFFVFQHGGWEDADRGSVLGYGLIPAAFNGHDLRPEIYQAFLSSCAPFFGVGERLVHSAQSCWVQPLPDWATLFTYAFLHGDFWHILGNMVFLWVFADNIEDSLGHFRFLVFYVLCALAGGFAYIWSDPVSIAPVIGASGAVAGIVAAYFILYPFAKVWILILGRIPLRLNAFLVLGFWILFQVYSLVVVDDSGDNIIAWWVHIGGLAAGAVLVVVLRRKGVRLFYHPPPPVPMTPPPAAAPVIAAGGPDRRETEPTGYVDGPWGRH